MDTNTEITDADVEVADADVDMADVPNVNMSYSVIQPLRAHSHQLG
jgi:hypothetical protein